MTDKKHLSAVELDTLFEAAANGAVEPSEILIARIMADADLVVDKREVAAHSNKEIAPRGRLAPVLRGIGGWPAIAGLAVATVAGVWIGYAPPDALYEISDTYFANVTGYDLEDFVPSYDAIFDEG